jgi:hypothetical protein
MDCETLPEDIPRKSKRFPEYRQGIFVVSLEDPLTTLEGPLRRVSFYFVLEAYREVIEIEG